MAVVDHYFVAFLLKRYIYVSMNFKSGDVVMLKSGGPKMTVEDRSLYSGVQKYKCKWFDGTKYVEDLFMEEMLSPAVGSPKPISG
jgi:uncharacterized protein YodC (DUF2158 family)